MLLSTMIEKIKHNFPDLEIFNQEENIICIPAITSDVGDVCIEDDNDELTVIIGKFTHWHVGCYEDDYTDSQKAEHIADEIVEFLKDLFNDQVIMWGSHNKSGGYYLKGEKPNSKTLFGKKHQEWVWSGPVNND